MGMLLNRTDGGEMRDIVAYIIVDENDSGTLGLEVSKCIAEGWQPFGSPFFIPGDEDDGPEFYQAMVKYRPD